MVYRGKPSKACWECRVKRRKCDLSRPACRQCLRAGSRCDGYRDAESYVTFRDQTGETVSKASPPAPGNSTLRSALHGKERVSALSYEILQVDQGPWPAVAVSPEDQALQFFFHHYVAHAPGRLPSHPDCLGIIYKRATGPGYLASLIVAVGLASLAHVRNAPMLGHAASQAVSRALRDMRTALADPSCAASDQMLVAVMLLALFETVTPDGDGNVGSWDRHVDGAVALIHLRGIGQLRNRIGRGIFLHARTEILLNCLQRGLRVPTILRKKMKEARHYETEHEAPASQLADLVADACAVLASCKDSSVDALNLSRCVSAILAVDTGLERWSESLPADYAYTTCPRQSDVQDTEMCQLGQYDTYLSVDVAHTWNLQRCVRILLHQALVALLSQPLPQQPSPLSASALQPSPGPPCPYLLDSSISLIQELSRDICSSVPYLLHACDKAGKPREGLRAASIVPLLWPLYLAGTSHGRSDALRDWVLQKMKAIEEETGIHKAKLMAAEIRRRSPSSVLI
ncbi:Zn(II)2Cys6 transcription factor [Aspergillus brunneoviolaceus CBS 621.78]|uniref:Uncharacterized protein n=1 Tax=Aspergillus brunneoviolaceus CBS 621.78 TaxID=1450534 RepID=A0ACD1GMK9_9EURO|nr:hypothetical protein BO95DRAFT_156699 [Aspergillus brunneoviolaceus CBS 621.78]RAH50514.1 hypothetical protein BO95DRAFT_156699 [Aspergillus brunneoviolaceus CBS 621.78]